MEATPGLRLGPGDIASAFRSAFPGRRLIIVSNREPYEHVWNDTRDEIEVRRPAGGLISALDPLMQSLGGTWVAWGSGDADADSVDAGGRIRVPPEAGAYTLRRLWLSHQDVQQYYLGYSNQLLWPLCHLRTELARIRKSYVERYRAVNRRFAEAALEEAGEEPAAIWFHDYHLALAPAELRARTQRHSLAHFWHIPFPPVEIFRIVPDGETLLEGLVANDLVGFHLPLFCDNFLRCCEAVLGMQVDWESRCVHSADHVCWVRAHPISIDIQAFEELVKGRQQGTIARIRARYARGGGRIGIGVDRIDYSKGLEEKLAALDRLWERNPEHRERFTYVQVAVPSRTGIDAYDWLSETVERMVWSINDRYGTDDWRPIHLLKDTVPPERLALLYRAADICVVSSLQDGMNLVAKEYVASHGHDGDGVLLLSRFAGAVEELAGCLPVNPYDREDFATRIHEALTMPQEERQARMNQLRSSLRTIYDWMAETFEVWAAAAEGGVPQLADADRWSRTG